MLDHVSLGVCNIERSRRFYDAALRPLGLVRILDFRGGKGADYGAAPGSPGVEFTITEESGPIAPPRGSHLCFRAPDRAAVAAFHKAALAAGGQDDGKPGPRSYHNSYYAAFVLDPDGHRVEAVCHASGEAGGDTLTLSRESQTTFCLATPQLTLITGA